LRRAEACAGGQRAIKGRLAFDFAGHFVGFFDEAVDRRAGRFVKLAAMPRASLPASDSVWQHCVFQASSPDALKNVRRYWHFCASLNNFALDQGVPQRRRTMYGSRGGWVIDI
jgi:hypothetical protein